MKNDFFKRIKHKSNQQTKMSLISIYEVINKINRKEKLLTFGMEPMLRNSSVLPNLNPENTS